MTIKYIQIETTNVCNYDCVECVHRHLKAKPMHISPVVWYASLDLIRHFKPLTVIPHMNGEPFMNPQFQNLLRDLCEIGVPKIDIYTNGSMLSPEVVGHFSSQYPRTQFFWIVSFHFYQRIKSTGEIRYRKDIWDDVTYNVIESLKVAKGNTTFALGTHMHDYVNPQEVNLEYWERVWFAHRRVYPQIIGINLNYELNAWTDLVKDSHAKRYQSCPYYSEECLFVGVTGTALPCCADLHETMPLGNIIDDPITKIEAKFAAFWYYFKEGKLSETCKRCLA